MRAPLRVSNSRRRWTDRRLSARLYWKRLWAMNAGLTAVSWLDWKLGARLLLKHPALTIIGARWRRPSRLGRSASKSPANCCTNGCRSMKAAESCAWRRWTRRRHAWSRGAPRFRDLAASLKTVAELGAARVSERNVLTGEGRVEALRVAGDHRVGVSAHPRAAPARQAVAAAGRKGRVRSPSWSWVTTCGRDSSCTTRRSSAVS